MMLKLTVMRNINTMKRRKFLLMMILVVMLKMNQLSLMKFLLRPLLQQKLLLQLTLQVRIAGSGFTTTYDPLEPFDWKNIGTTVAVNVAAPTNAQGTETVPTAKKSAKTASKVPTAQPSGTTTANPDIGESTEKPAAQPSGTTMAGPGNQDGDESGKDN